MNTLSYDCLYLIWLELSTKLFVNQTCKRYYDSRENKIDAEYIADKINLLREYFSLFYCKHKNVNIFDHSQRENALWVRELCRFQYLIEKICNKSNIDCLEYLYNQKNISFGPKDSLIKNEIAAGGSIEGLQWCLDKGMRFTDIANNADGIAAERGHLHVLKWFKEQGLNVVHQYNILEAATGGHKDIIEWLRNEGSEWPDENEIDWNPVMYTVEESDYDLMMWLMENGCPYNEELIVESIFENDDGYIIKELLRKGLVTMNTVLGIADDVARRKV